MWLSLHRLRINFIVLLMRSEKPNHCDAGLVLHHDNQSIVISLDIKDYSAALEDARLRMSRFDVLRRLPLRGPSDGSPRIVLRPSSLDPSMTYSRREIAIDDIGTDNNH